MAEKFLYRNVYVDNYDLMIKEIRKKVLHEVEIHPEWLGYDVVSISDFLDSCPIFHNFIKTKNLMLRIIAVIVVRPNRHSPIHTDAITPGFNTYALNMGISNYEHTKTQLFSADPSAVVERKNTAGHPFMAYDETKCSVITEFNLISPVLFDTSIPHRVFNDTLETRISVSFRFLQNPLDVL